MKNRLRFYSKYLNRMIEEVPVTRKGKVLEYVCNRTSNKLILSLIEVQLLNKDFK